MSAAPDPRVVLSCTAEALGAYVLRNKPVDVGHVIGRAATTAPRWGDDTSAWRVQEFLLALCDDSELRRAFIASLFPRVEARPLEVEHDLRLLTKSCGKAIERMMDVLDDDQAQPHEIPETLELLRLVQERVATAISDMEARQRSLQP